jgi:ribosomal protein L37E
MSYTINDKRGKDKEETLEVCRFCGSRTVHTREYGSAKQECAEYLREQNIKYEKHLRDRFEAAKAAKTAYVDAECVDDSEELIMEYIDDIESEYYALKELLGED